MEKTDEVRRGRFQSRRAKSFASENYLDYIPTE